MKFDSFTHVQAAPATTWTIDHNLGRKVVSDVMVDINGVRSKALPLSVIHVSDNQLVINFSTGYAGRARLVTTGQFTLSNPSWVPDDITPEVSALTLQTEDNQPLQADPGNQYIEADTTPAPAPAPAPTTLTLDTFTGAAGPLADHEGETGADWTATTVDFYGQGGADIGRYSLTGTGLLQTDGSIGEAALVYPSGSADVIGDHTIELDFIWNGGAFNIYTGFQANGSATYVLNWFRPSVGQFEIDGSGLDSAGGFQGFNGPFYADALAQNVTHTLKIEVVGTTKTVSIDDVQVFQLIDDLPTPASTHGFPWIWMDDVSGGAATIRFSRIEVFT